MNTRKLTAQEWRRSLEWCFDECVYKCVCVCQLVHIDLRNWFGKDCIFCSVIELTSISHVITVEAIKRFFLCRWVILSQLQIKWKKKNPLSPESSIEVWLTDRQTKRQFWQADIKQTFFIFNKRFASESFWDVKCCSPPKNLRSHLKFRPPTQKKKFFLLFAQVSRNYFGLKFLGPPTLILGGGCYYAYVSHKALSWLQFLNFSV